MYLGFIKQKLLFVPVEVAKEVWKANKKEKRERKEFHQNGSGKLKKWTGLSSEKAKQTCETHVIQMILRGTPRFS